MVDFTQKQYRNLCSFLSKSDKKVITFENYFKNGMTAGNFVILRHDVDAKPNNALKFAQIEKDFGRGGGREKIWETANNNKKFGKS